MVVPRALSRQGSRHSCLRLDPEASSTDSVNEPLAQTGRRENTTAAQIELVFKDRQCSLSQENAGHYRCVSKQSVATLMCPHSQ